jgi:hypothetical protein
MPAPHAPAWHSSSSWAFWVLANSEGTIDPKSELDGWWFAFGLCRVASYDSGTVQYVPVTAEPKPELC